NSSTPAFVDPIAVSLDRSTCPESIKSPALANPGTSTKRENQVKPIKMLGLAALAALLAMAFVGASSAMAESTALCSADIETEEEESAGSIKNECEVTHVHETSVGKGKLLSSSLNVECDVLFLGEVVATGSPLRIEGNFTYSNCNAGCTATE